LRHASALRLAGPDRPKWPVHPVQQVPSAGFTLPPNNILGLDLAGLAGLTRIGRISYPGSDYQLSMIERFKEQGADTHPTISCFDATAREAIQKCAKKPNAWRTEENKATAGSAKPRPTE